MLPARKIDLTETVLFTYSGKQCGTNNAALIDLRDLLSAERVTFALKRRENNSNGSDRNRNTLEDAACAIALSDVTTGHFCYYVEV